MPIRKPKPTSAGRRFVTYPDFAEITRTSPEKSLVEGLKKSGGRNSYGRKTSRHRGGGAKRMYRIIDFKRRKDGIPAKVAHIEYDPNRSAYIALLHYADGEKRYILAPQRLRVGMTVQSGPTAEIRVGNSLPLANMPAGTVVHNVELRPRRGGQMARAGRAGRQLLGQGGGHGRRLRDLEAAVGRDADGARGVPRDRRLARQHRSPEREDRKGRAQAPHGRAPADARYRDAPRRPPTRWWRGLDDRGSPSGHSLGRPDTGLPHP